MKLLGNTLLFCNMHGCFECLDETFGQTVGSWVVRDTADVLNSIRCQIQSQFFCNKLWTIVRYQLKSHVGYVYIALLFTFIFNLLSP